MQDYPSETAVSLNCAMERQQIFEGAYQSWVQEYGTLSAYDQTLIEEHIADIPVGKINIFWRLSLQIDCFVITSLLDSLQAQLYSNWRVTLLIPYDFPIRLEKIILDAAKHEPRLAISKPMQKVVHVLDKQSVAALLIEGEGQLAPHALYLLALKASACYAWVYADEDEVNMLGRHSPVFKPQYSPEFAKQTDYIGSMGLVSCQNEMVARLVLDFVDQKTNLANTFRQLLVLPAKQVAHIPFVLFHAMHKRTRSDESIQYKSFTNNFGANSPKVSIIIPTKNHLDFLQPCLESLFEKTQYASDAYEVIVIDNGSTDSDVLAYMATMVQAGKIRLLIDPGKFNFSRLNNKAVQISKGDILVFLNNDIVIDHPQWLSMLVEQAIKSDVGVVGGKLLYPDRTIQHAGLILGLYGSTAVHVHTHWSEYSDSYMDFNNAVREISTLTGACIALKKHLFLEVGCFDEKLAVAFNDIALCLAVLSRGYRNIYIGNTLAIHYESKTRGHDDTDEKRYLHRQEAAYTRSLYHELIKQDPFYNPNLSWLDLYGLAHPPRVQKPWLQFNAQQSERLNVLFLTASEPLKQNTLGIVTQQAHYFLNQGHKVYVDGHLLVDIADKFECKAILLNDADAAKFVVKNNIHCIVAHGVPFYSSARWLGQAVVTVAIDYGDPSASYFETEQYKKNQITERELSICAADLVCSFSESEKTVTYHPNTILLFKNDEHLAQLHNQVVNLVKSRTV